MLEKIALSEGQCVISKGACPFQEILDHFPKAQFISVVTFNISKLRNRLLGDLKKSHANQRVITNIPGRRDNCQGADAIGAENAIRLYLDKLDPKRFNPLARVFFCFKNHTKIIKTDRIAYVGSANFSDESQDNWEAGVILHDPAVLARIEELIDDIERDSVRYYGEEMQKLIAPLLAARMQLNEILEQFSSWPTAKNRAALVGQLTEIYESIGQSKAACSIQQPGTAPIPPLVDPGLLKDIGMKLRDFDQHSERIVRADSGEIDAGEVPVDNDGEIPEWGFESVRTSMDGRRDELIGEIRECVRRLTSQIELSCSVVSESRGKIFNTGTTEQ